MSVPSRFTPHLGISLRKYLIHLMGERLSSLTGDLRSKTILFPVGEIGELSVRRLIEEKGQHRATEILGDHDGCLVFPGARSFERVVFVGDHPVQLFVGS